MKKTLLTAVIALTGLAAFTTAHAQQFTQTNATYGDLILGFETTGGGGSTNLLVDLGSVTNTAQLVSLNINLSSDLVTAFGTNWASTVSYGLYSVTSGKEIFASGPTTQTQGYALESSSGAGIQKTDFANFYGVFNNNGLVADTTAHGVLESTATTYSWTYYTPNNGAFQNANYANIEVPVGSTADLFAQVTGSSGNGVNTGLAFTVNGSGNLSAVPEPSTYALFGLGALLFFSTYRRRTNA
jgi:hypothetical protein